MVRSQVLEEDWFSALRNAKALAIFLAQSFAQGFVAFFRPVRTLRALSFGARIVDSRSDWPPQDGKEYIRSEVFGTILIDLVKRFGARYPEVDFSDALAEVFVWFDTKLSENRRFINSRRFPTASAFHAYLRQAIWNAARLTARKRRR